MTSPRGDSLVARLVGPSIFRPAKAAQGKSRRIPVMRDGPKMLCCASARAHKSPPPGLAYYPAQALALWKRTSQRLQDAQIH